MLPNDIIMIGDNMILKRPYAILIKYFRLIHLVITALLFYLVIQNRDIYKYLKSVIESTVNRYNALEYINYGVYFYMVVAIILCIAVYYLLKFKDKPRKIYIFTVVGYIVVGIFMYVLYTYMQSFSSTTIDQKVIRLYKDIFSITLFFQYYVIIFMFIRGMGFDIKKFDFNSDKRELNITDEDSEEVEVNLGVDTTNVVRGFRKQKREFGYFFQEYKMYIIVILAIIFIIGGYKLYSYLSDKYKVYGENDTIGGMYQLVIRESYFKTEKSKNYVLVNFDIMKYGKTDRFNVGNMKLVIDDFEYLPNKNICYMFSSYGNCYKKQYVDDEYSNYLLVYEVDNLNIKKAYIVYSENYDEDYKVKLNLQF